MTRSNRNVTVYGAYGHTGRFVVAELCERGWTPILAGRDAGKLDEMGSAFPELERRVASVMDPSSLDRALVGAFGVINCAGPFLDTAVPMLEAALRARVHYLDVCAEQAVALGIFERFSETARNTGITVIPAMAFYGGLADLLATTAMQDWPDADAIEIGVALDRWHPTAGTRAPRRPAHGSRLVFTDGKLEPLADPPPSREWTFCAPFATQQMVALPFSEIITISRHMRSDKVQSYMNLTPLNDLRDPSTPPPTSTDARGRSAQVFAVDVLVRRNGQTRRAIAHGRDIYAISAPLVVEALQRISDGRCRKIGVAAPAEAFVAHEFLASIRDLRLEGC
ncbi:saccharopine dehydrogenase family protein [Lysobacter gummosus]|uniref:Saccharopine dehydrogenase NADP-binding domain-containing protein n=1 Tax=Lysobacter gummosus TaxID=262324 RepID=A0ABY3XAV4_9GAMM|nr:saccharopine dehydrogenase NADP-binding domain-containing protein [Lysobacter gummosus]ALN91934.1 saccharopine dehydrogenase family protein [Lysobacter gummosus]UNP27590.1 saccharopine dehydrogenase NADP-binding domain-containing protein [Lysobacter gummosus]